MREIEIDGILEGNLDLFATGVKSIIQNIKMILTTPKGSVWLLRDFGIDTQLIDRPANIIHPNLMVDITEQINLYEPRAKLISITFREGESIIGNIIPVVRIGLTNL